MCEASREMTLDEYVGSLPVSHAARAEIAGLREVASWAQSVLTALNVGHVFSESPLHKKLREVMIAFRENTSVAVHERLLREQTAEILATVTTTVDGVNYALAGRDPDFDAFDFEAYHPDYGWGDVSLGRLGLTVQFVGEHSGIARPIEECYSTKAAFKKELMSAADKDDKETMKRVADEIDPLRKKGDKDGG